MAEMNQCFQNAKIYNETESMLYQVYDLSDWLTLWNAREKSILNSKLLNYNMRFTSNRTRLGGLKNHYPVDSATVKPRIKEPVNFDFRLKCFLYNWYLEKKSGRSGS